MSRPAKKIDPALLDRFLAAVDAADAQAVRDAVMELDGLKKECHARFT
ncbi:MAG: hypothetical protein AB7E47_16530 [Desulfovibrionaceae bacterium]